MAELSYICTACQKDLTVDESLAGQDVACPTCAHVMTVPRIRAKLTMKGHQAASSKAKKRETKPENFSGLADVNVFGDEREDIVLRKRRWALGQQALASVGMLVTIAVVVYFAYRFYDARETRKKNHALAIIHQEEAAELRHAQRVTAKDLSRLARNKHGFWSLSDEESFRLWRALNHVYPAQQARARLDAWVQYDAESFGLFSEAFGQIQNPAAIEGACQRLAGMSLGLSPEMAQLPPLDEFRQLAMLKLAPVE
jgi:DNA-directed RNA polymerase subunit RPC12/RpoP